MTSDFTSVPRSEWIRLFEKFNSSLLEACSGFTEKQWNRTSPYIGWRVRDVMVNITRAKVVNFRQLLNRALNDNPIAPEEFDTFLRGQRELESRKKMPVSKILDDYRKEYEDLIMRYKDITEEQWLKPGWFFTGPMNVRGLFLTEFGDNVFHMRDMLLPNGLWEGLDPEYTCPLADWFMREYRPAHFRPENAGGVNVKILYRLSGTGGGAWTMTIKDRICTVERGASEGYDVILAASVEDMVAVALARTSPVAGKWARMFDGIKGENRRTEVVATVLHATAFGFALAGRKIRMGGNRGLGIRVNRKCF